MSTGRRKHQLIALADILVNQDQFNSESDSEVPDFDRMHIHIDMPDTRYLSAHHSDSVPNTCSVVPQSAAIYRDMTPFTTAPSFNFPATADATLLTPISNAGSPPLHQRPYTKGTMRAYHQPQASSNAQQPTPPNTSTGVYYPAYISSSSQSPSPLTVNPHAPDYMTPYMRQSPNHMHGHPSPKDDLPPPMNHNHYLGHYTVSGNPNESDVSNSFREYADFNQVDQVDPSLITRPGGHIHMHPHMMTTSAAPTPILAQPDPMHYHRPMQITTRPGEIEDLRDPEILKTGHPGHSTYPSHMATSRQSPRGGRRRPAQPRRAPSRPHVQPAPPRSMEVASQDNDSESLGEGAEAVVLSEKCEDDARFIFETRRSLVKSGMKGKGMWEEISKRYEEAYGQRLEKATLQMRLTRNFAKHAIWPEKEIDRLKEAFEYVEQKRYKLIVDRMKEIGGGQCWNWTPQLIEAKLIDLGYEEANVDEKTNTRKRRRLARRRRAAAAQQNPALLHGGEDWVNGLGLHRVAMQAPVRHDNEDPEDLMPNYTPEQRDSYIEEVVSMIKPEQEESSPEPDIMDVSYHRNEDNRDYSHQQNTRVAKQAVENLMLNGMHM